MTKCTSLLVREFWLDGSLVSACCCLFVGFDDGTWLKAYYNDENYRWVLEATTERPDIAKPKGDSQFYYPYKEYLPAHLQDIGALEKSEHRGDTELVLIFSSGVEVALLYDVRLEESSVTVRA
ncbi:MAG: hypothetical protein CME36_09370 [unclassified Hahellaceae]|nr:hypothetical protein [Hahellaceae bacterium]